MLDIPRIDCPECKGQDGFHLDSCGLAPLLDERARLNLVNALLPRLESATVLVKARQQMQEQRDFALSNVVTPTGNLQFPDGAWHQCQQGVTLQSEKTLQQLASAVRTYGDHAFNCDSRAQGRGESACNCGFREASNLAKALFA